MAAEPLLLFAHGAGKGSSSEWMQSWAARMAGIGRVVTFDYPYMAAGRKAPDRLPKLEVAHLEALAEARRGDEPVVLAGKSMGSRVGCHVAQRAGARAIVCFGYPLRSAKGKVRDEVLLGLPPSIPVLFVSGTRDSLCPLDLLEEVRAKMSAPSTLFRVEGGNHSLILSKRSMKESGLTQESSDAAIAEAVSAFVVGALAG